MKRKSIKKQIKSKLYISKATPFKPAPRKDVVDGVQQVLREPQFKKLIKHINKISIMAGGNRTTKRVTVGSVATDPNGKKSYKIYDYPHIPVVHYKSTAVHELAHIGWGVMAKWHNEAFQKFNRIVDQLRPVNDYLARKEYIWRAEPRFSANQYCNEMHSAAAQIYYFSKEDAGHIWSFPNDQVTLLSAYRELHSLNE